MDDALSTGDNRPPVYWEDHKDGTSDLIIRASALGTSCLYELTAAGQGYQPATLPKSLLRAFAEGHEAEPMIVRRLEHEHGFVFRSAQDEADWEVEPGLIVRHHPDGIAELGKPFLQHIGVLKRNELHLTTYAWGELAVVEIKWLSDGLWQKFRAHGMQSVIEDYGWQGSVMMQYHEIPLLWVGGNKGGVGDPETGERTPCPDQGKLHFQWVDHKPISEDELVAKARKIKELVCGEDILESGAQCTDPTNWPCRYLHVRPEEGARVEPRNTVVVGDGDTDEANDEIRNYLLFKGQADEAAKRAEFFKAAIMERAGDAEVLETDRWRVPIARGRNTSADWGLMQNDGVEVEQYKKQTTYKYINRKHIKRKDDEDD